MKNRIINVQDVPILISQQELDDYICITDIAKAKTGESDRKSTRLNSSHYQQSRMPSSA